MANLCDTFWAIVRQEVRAEVRERIEASCQIGGIRFQNAIFEELTQPIPGVIILEKEITVRAPADTRFGYRSKTPLVITNAAGNPLSPQPDPATITVTISDPAVVGEARVLSDMHVFFNPLDAALPDATSDITFSAVETGTDDDAVIHYIVDPDRVGGVDVGGLEFEEATGPVA